MTGIYAIINELEPLEIPYGPGCPAPLAGITHRCYIGKATNFERRWDKDHVQYLLNGKHCCSYLLDAFQDWLRADSNRLKLLNLSPKVFKSTWLVRAAVGPVPAWRLGPFEFRVLEEVPEALLFKREEAYHKANLGGYAGSDPAKRYRRRQKWDGK